MAVYHTAMPARAILFDFFGTLVEYSEGTDGLSFAASHGLLAESGATADEPAFLVAWDTVYRRLESRAIATQSEFPFSAIVDGLLAELSLASVAGDFHERFIETFLREWGAGVRYHGWLPNLLADLSRNFRLGVITNTYHPTLVPDHLERMGVAHHFEVVVKSHDLGFRKPAAAIFEHALERMSLAPSEAIFVGDSYVADYLGPTTVGMQSFLIDPGKRHDIPDGARINSLAELPQRLR